MTVPEIPEDAVLKACERLRYHEYPLDMLAPSEDYEAPYLVQAVWPALYAAALRHAAEKLTPETLQQWYGVNSGAGGAHWLAASRDHLRRLADEATS